MFLGFCAAPHEGRLGEVLIELVAQDEGMNARRHQTIERLQGLGIIWVLPPLVRGPLADLRGPLLVLSFFLTVG